MSYVDIRCDNGANMRCTLIEYPGVFPNKGYAGGVCNQYVVDGVSVFRSVARGGLTQYDGKVGDDIIQIVSDGHTFTYSGNTLYFDNKSLAVVSPGAGSCAIPIIIVDNNGVWMLLQEAVSFQKSVSPYDLIDAVSFNPPTSDRLGYFERGNFTYPATNFVGNQAAVACGEFLKKHIAPTDPYDGLGEGGLPGGGTVSIPGFPELTATSTGIVGLFSPSAAQMQQLADFMWTDFGGTGTSTIEVLEEIVDALKRLISNPLDYILGLNIIPSQGLSIGSSSTIKFGFVSSGVSMPRLSNQYFTVDCGSISFPALCGDTFLDYAPYSKFSIYLPYIGVKEVDANDFVGHTIGVVYHGDVVTGGVTAYITKDGSVMYQYSGSCALNVPLSSDNWGSTLSAAVNIATAVATGAVTGGAAGVGMAAAKGAASVAANPSQLSPQVQHSGAVSGSAGCMGVQYPFVIREAVRFHSTSGFNKISGYPLFYYRSLGDMSGFTTVVNVHLENIPATQGEIAEIEKLLKEGVIL